MRELSSKLRQNENKTLTSHFISDVYQNYMKIF